MGGNSIVGDQANDIATENSWESNMKKSGGSRRRQRSRLVLFPDPFQGHVNPMLQLATLLHSKGFSITIVHIPFNTPIPSNYPPPPPPPPTTTTTNDDDDDDHLFSFEPISDGLSSHEREASTKDFIGYLEALNLKCVGPFQDCLARLIAQQDGDEDKEEPINNNRITCVISDASISFGD